MDLEHLRFPIGPFEAPPVVTDAHVATWIDEIAGFPAALRAAVAPLSEVRLDTSYRPDGWTVRQVVHHCADSHMNSVLRFKWALTEDRPTIKTYFEERWAALPDAAKGDVALSLALLEGLHARWVELLRRLDHADLAREFVHPDSGPVRLDRNIGIYAWHGRHHLAHITHLARREGWTD